MADLESGLAFEDIIPIVEPQKKPLTTGLTEVRSSAHSLAAISSYVDTLGPYLDCVKWTCGTQHLLPRAKVRDINTFLHRNQKDYDSFGRELGKYSIDLKL